jgi:hypothetical protein
LAIFYPIFAVFAEISVYLALFDTVRRAHICHSAHICYTAHICNTANVIAIAQMFAVG